MYQGKVYVLLHDIRSWTIVNHCCDSVVITIVLFIILIVVNIQIEFLCSLMVARNLYFMLTLILRLGCLNTNLRYQYVLMMSCTYVKH